MRDIEGIEQVVALLAPHQQAIQTHFQQENQKFIRLIAGGYDELGRVLRCHLVVEHYLGRFLEQQLPTIGGARLSFAQKATLLPTGSSAAAFVRPGIVRLNTIRNKFAHNWGTSLAQIELGAIQDVLSVARAGVQFGTPIEAIEAFTTVACTFLIVPPPELQQVFMQAFQPVRVRDNSADAA